MLMYVYNISICLKKIIKYTHPHTSFHKNVEFKKKIQTQKNFFFFSTFHIDLFSNNDKQKPNGLAYASESESGRLCFNAMQ